MLKPERQVMAEPRYRLAVFACISSAGITLFGRRNSLVDLLSAVAANLSGCTPSCLAMLAWLFPAASRPQSDTVGSESAAGKA